jgi:hypothetical protein
VLPVNTVFAAPVFPPGCNSARHVDIAIKVDVLGLRVLKVREQGVKVMRCAKEKRNAGCPHLGRLWRQVGVVMQAARQRAAGLPLGAAQAVRDGGEGQWTHSIVKVCVIAGCAAAGRPIGGHGCRSLAAACVRRVVSFCGHVTRSFGSSALPLRRGLTPNGETMVATSLSLAVASPCRRVCRRRPATPVTATSAGASDTSSRRAAVLALGAGLLGACALAA